jgi:hypothetical protein
MSWIVHHYQSLHDKIEVEWSLAKCMLHGYLEQLLQDRIFQKLSIMPPSPPDDRAL